jgi:hypothetical protein
MQASNEDQHSTTHASHPNLGQIQYLAAKNHDTLKHHQGQLQVTDPSVLQSETIYIVFVTVFVTIANPHSHHENIQRLSTPAIGHPMCYHRGKF